MYLKFSGDDSTDSSSLYKPLGLWRPLTNHLTSLAYPTNLYNNSLYSMYGGLLGMTGSNVTLSSLGLRSLTSASLPVTNTTASSPQGMFDYSQSSSVPTSSSSHPLGYSWHLHNQRYHPYFNANPFKPINSSS